MLGVMKVQWVGHIVVIFDFYLATIWIHGDEIECPVESARKVGYVDIKGKLLVQQMEHLVPE